MTTLFMRARRSGWLRVGTLTLSAMAIALPFAASASSSTASESKDSAAFRKEFMSYITQMQQVGAMLQSNPRGRAALSRRGVTPSSLARSREAVRHMTPSELAVLQKAFASVPDWQAHPRDLKAVLRRNGFSPNGTSRAFAVGPDCDPGPGSPLGITDWYIAVGVALALEIAHEAIPDDIVTSPLQIAAAGLWGIAATAALVLESVNGVEAECGDAKLEAFTRTQLDVAVSTRATQLSLDTFHNAFTTNATTVNTKLDAITSSLGSAHTKLDELTITVNDQGKLALRLQIEADLSESGDPVALFEIPAAQNGYLELAREIVADTIAKMTAAGQDVGKAAKYLAEGDAAAAAGKYKAAYSKYGKAYREAAGQGGDDDDD